MASFLRSPTSLIDAGDQTPDHREDLIAWVVLAVILSLLGILYFRSTGTLIEINDEAGYLYGGSQIAATGAATYENAYNQQVGPYFTLSAFRVHRSGDPRFYLIYPLGYPLAIAATRLILPGWPQAIFYVAPAFALLAALGAFLLGRALRALPVGLWAALLLLLDPAIIRNGTRAFSDGPALACVLLGYAFLLAPRRASWLRGLTCGFFFGYACLIRQISVAALAGVPLWLFLNRAQWREQRATWLSMGLVLCASGGAVLIYNNTVFGGPFTTGYALQHHWIPYPAFSWQNFMGHSPIRPGGYRSVWEMVFRDVGVIGLLAAGLGVLALPRRASATFGLTVLAVALTYAFYAWPASDSGGRFVLPVLAILRLLAAFGLAWLFTKLRLRWEVALVVGVALILLLQGRPASDAFTEVQQRAEGTASRVAYVQAVAAQTAPESVFISRLYGDHFILYGRRSALLLEMLVTRAPGRYRKEEFAPTLTRAVQTLLSQGAPVYVVADGLAGTRAGFFDPLPVLQRQFQMTLCPDVSPPLYRVLPMSR